MLPEGIDASKSVMISSCAPVWLHAYRYLVHEYHPTLRVVCFDPRFSTVVTSTHSYSVRVRKAIAALRRQKALVIVDAGGMVQPEKRSILEACTHYLIISSKPEAIEPWHAFCRGELRPLAVIHSVLEETCEVLQREPFLELRCGPWVQGKTAGIPAALKAVLVELLGGAR